MKILNSSRSVISLLHETFSTEVRQTHIEKSSIISSFNLWQAAVLFPSKIFFLKFNLMYRTDFWTLWEKARVGWSERIALKHVYYQVWNRSPAQIGCMRQVLGAGALGRPRGWGGEGGGRGIQDGEHVYVYPWLIHVNVWQKPLQYCKVISLQLIKINGKK